MPAGIVAWSGLDEEDLIARIGGQAVGEHAACAARTDDDVVVRFHESLPGHFFLAASLAQR
jgi:hypothetical protein